MKTQESSALGSDYLLLRYSLKMSTSFGCRYLFGKEVYGKAYAVFGIIENGVKKSLPYTLSKVDVRSRTKLLIQFKCNKNVICSLKIRPAILYVVLLDSEWRRTCHAEKEKYHSDL